MVDIPNHEDCLRELSKTSLVNNVTIVLCWSAAEAGRYLELYKSYENASFAAIRGQQSSSYADKLVEFVTVPRSLNKSDAVALVANFGSLKNAINADHEQLGMIGGWGGIKVKRWSAAIEEPFRAKKAAKRGLQKQGPGQPNADRGGGQNSQRTAALEQAVPLSRVPLRDMPTSHAASASPAGAGQSSTNQPSAKQFQFLDDGIDDEEETLAVAHEGPNPRAQRGEQSSTGHRTDAQDEALAGGVAAALARLRENG